MEIDKKANKHSKFSIICAFCGSSPGKKSSYKDAAIEGGYGTLEEFLEVITWAQLGIHDKPVGLLNVDGYYNSFLTFIDKAVEEGFICPSARHIIVSAPNAKKVVARLEMENEQLRRSKACEQTLPQPSFNHSNSQFDH